MPVCLYLTAHRSQIGSENAKFVNTADNSRVFQNFSFYENLSNFSSTQRSIHIPYTSFFYRGELYVALTVQPHNLASSQKLSGVKTALFRLDLHLSP